MLDGSRIPVESTNRYKHLNHWYHLPIPRLFQGMLRCLLYTFQVHRALDDTCIFHGIQMFGTLEASETRTPSPLGQRSRSFHRAAVAPLRPG